MSALDKLIEAVEAGKADLLIAQEAFQPSSTPSMTIFGEYLQGFRWVLRAYDGDLNAALALHEGLLPGWRWEVSATSFGGDAIVWDEETPERCLSTTPARAWLLAILRAYRTQQEPA